MPRVVRCARPRLPRDGTGSPRVSHANVLVERGPPCILSFRSVTERLRVLVATPQLPGTWARHGGGTYLAQLLLAMAEDADVALVSLARPFELGREAELSPPLRRATAVLHLW